MRKPIILRASFVSLLFWLFLFFNARPASAHLGPWIVVGYWDPVQQCVTRIHGEDYAENVAKQTLPHEWFDSWPYESLRAGAELIRTDVIYHYLYPQGNWGLCNRTGRLFHFRNTTMAYKPGQTAPNSTDAVNYTHPYGWKSGGSWVFYYFNSCYQYKTRDRASAGLNHIQIIRDYYATDAQACNLTVRTNNSHVSVN